MYTGKGLVQPRCVHSNVGRARWLWLPIYGRCCTYDYLCTGDSTGITVPNDKVPSHTLRFALEKVRIDIRLIASIN